MTIKTYVFECNSNTYLDCVQKSVFGSNKPWPLDIKAGDYPPDLQEDAVKTVLQQAELLCVDWTVQSV